MSKSRAKRKGKNLRKLGAAIVAMMLVAIMVIGLIPNDTVLAADYLSDLNTTTKYTESLGDNASTEYAGRIWTDKTVFTEDAIFTGYSGAQQTVEKGDDDFLVSFSALATSQSVSGQTQAPIDVVFIIDLSGSMSNQDSNMTNSANQTYSRIKFTVDAVNKAIADLMDLNPYTRVGVVGFNESGTTLLELDRYTKSGNNEYFSLSRNTGNSSYATLYTRAVNSSGRRITKDTSVQGGTNIQHGLYQGMSLLANATSTTVTIDGKEVTRVPSVVLLSDGAPTYSSSNSSWWAPVVNNNNPVQGPGSSSYYGNGMLAMMNGAYMKAQIDSKYGVTGTAQAATVYTIGMGINDLVEKDRWGNVTSTADRDLARVTLNPRTYFDSTTNAFAVSIKNAWNYYTGQTGRDTTPDIDVNNGDEYTLRHPQSNDISGDALKNYVDLHYDADDADSIAEVFQNIVNNISINTPEIPTEHDSENPMSSGYITYTDPIGEYMEVKDMKSIIYAGVQYKYDEAGNEGETSTVTKEDGTTVTTYKFKQTAAGNEVYGEEELNHILIDVTTSTDAKGIKTQVLTVKIPASLIPIRVNTVELNAGGAVTSHTNNGAYPIRVLYTVGLQEKVMSDGNISLEMLSDNYIAKHSNDDGTIDFYSNLYSGNKINDTTTIGDATVVFDAAATNPFYYVQEDMPIYTNRDCTQLANTARLSANQTYYYKETYYHGTQVVTKATERTGAQLTQNITVVRHDDGYWYRPAGTVRVNRMLEFEGKKSANATGTATDFYYPTYNGETGHFTVYLGNNGVMSVEATGSLEITKAVTAADGLTAPDADFTFTVDLEGATGSYTYRVTDAAGNGVRQGTVADGGTIVLKAGQKATIVNLPPKATYTVTEAAVDGFTASADELTGTITAGSVATAAFTNHYTVESTTFPTDGTLQGKKVFEGRNWAEGDAFTFFISAANDAPLPNGYDANVGVKVEHEDATNNEALFDFGTITFTKPGLYRYTIMEKEPENHEYLAGVSYSRALYSVGVYVVDDGDGTLSYTSNVQKLYTDDATPLFAYDENEQLVLNPGEEAQDAIVFTNTYNADSVVRVPVAVKNYTDNSGQKPLHADMFQFKFTPLGIVGTDGLVADTAGENPMPVENGVKLTSVTTTNEGENITFLPITFTHDDIPEGQDSITYRYQMEEVLPEGATAENNYTVNGMTYDGNKYVIDVTVSIDAESDEVNVDAVYSNDERIVRFTNSYNTIPVIMKGETAIQGEKTLTGRDMNAGEFEFTFTAANNATAKAVRDKVVVLGKEKATIAASEDGVATGFDFGETTFTKPGTYTFNVAETKGTAGGVTYDEHVCTVTVVVTDNNGQLEAAVTYNNGANATDNSQAVFNNTYKATFDIATAIDLSGTKKLTGRPLTAGGFYFSVQALDGAPMGAKAAYVPAGEDLEADANGVYEGAITFLEDVTYTKAGTYVYQISEVIPTDDYGNVIDNGVTYDTSVYTVTVTVTDDLQGTLRAAITEILKNGVAVADNKIVFVNTYKADETEYVFRALQKVLSGERKDALKAGEFEFERTADQADGIAFYKVDDPTTAEDESQIQVGVTGEDVVTNDANGIVLFGNIKFTKPGTYVVSIREKIPTDAVDNGDGTYTKNGVTYDTHVVQGTFTVVDNLNGSLVATVTNIIGSSTFTNVYKTTGILVGATNLNVTKILDVTKRTPNTWTEDDEFTFILEAGDAATTQAIADGEVVLPAETSVVIGKPDNGGITNSKAFGDIVFHAAGEYTFTIREEAGTELGMDYDVTARQIKVVTTDNGNGTLTVLLSSKDDLNFKNVYNIDDVVLPGHENLHVNKVFTGRPNGEWLDTDSFTFALEPVGDTIAKTQGTDPLVEMTTTTVVVTKDNKDHAHFGNITFNAAGTYEFVIKEVVPTEGIPGVTYDSDLDRKVTVVVTEQVQDGNKYLVVAIDYENSDVDAEANNAFTFTNTYGTTEVTLEKDTVLGVTKAIAGRNWFESDAFTFTLEAGDAATVKALEEDVVIFWKNAAEKDAALEQMSTVVKYVTGEKNENQISKFNPITFTKPGTYSFLVEETDADTATMQYDKHTDTIVVEVVDNGDGTLSIFEASTLGEMTWTNTFTPTPVIARLSGIKRIEGRQMTEKDVFYFNISALNDLARAAMPEKTQVTNAIPADNKATITFGPLTFKAAGTYEYAISERTVNAHGITSDTGYVKAIVKVDYNPADGTLSVAEGYPMYEKVNSAGTGFEFINNYSTVGILDGSTHLKVTKNFTGRANNAWLAGDAFTFTLATGNDATAQAVTDGIVTLPENKDGITISYTDTLKEKAFGSIRFTQTGDYQFVITEIVPEGGYKDGITYDNAPQRTINVKVVDNGDGTLTATVVEGSHSLTFNNTYDTTETTLIGAENLVVEKNIVGREWITEDTYSFTLAADMTHALTKAALEGEEPIIVMPAADELHVTITKETENHKAAFGDITFKEPGRYKFVITEDIPTEGKVPGITYDSRTKHITVVVVDNNNGTMTATATVDNHDNLVFVNRYTAAPVSATFEGTKKMAGRELKDTDDFEFTISAVAGTPLPAETTVVNADDGTITFAPITYNKVGTYTYEIKETGGSASGVTNAVNTVVATVVVTDNFKGQLEANVTYSEGGFEFENTYKADSVGVIVEGDKTVTASDGNSYTMAGAEFKFEIIPAQSNPTSDPVEQGFVYNTASGDITFINATYTESGVYEYTVHEANSELAGITEDDAEYLITVTVEDDGNGNLVATPSFTKDGQSVQEIVFDNKYVPNKATAVLSGNKILESEHKDELVEGLFTFTLNAVTEDAPMPTDNKATNAATGYFQFGEITYTKPGEYVYRITEVQGSAKGYIYDDASYEVTVTVEDENGYLKATVDGLDKVVFTNGYVPKVVTLQGNTALKGTKTLEGRDLEVGEFEFTLTAEDGTPMPAKTTVKNTADGSFSFEPITFRKAGTYYYTIAETNNGLGGVRYDGTVYTVKVVVTDEGGYLAAEVTYLVGSGEDAQVKDSVVFENAYEADSISMALYAKKTLSGRDLNEEEFSFELKSGDDVLQTKQNDAEGLVSFDAIEYDAVGEYVYTIAEVAGDKGGVRYDANTFTVTVTVTDNLEGQLEAAITSVTKQTDDEIVDVENKEVVFENAYTPAKTSITLEGKKTLEGRKLAEGEFTFLLLNEAGEEVGKATNAEDGTITFDELEFTQVGIFKYTVVEDSSAQAEGIVYDDAKYEIEIQVTDNLEGSLVAEVISQEEIIFNNQYTEPKVTATKLQSVNNGEATTEAQEAKAGDVVTYTIKLANDGNATARNIVLTDKVPTGLNLIAGTVEGGDEIQITDDGTITWTIYRLDAGAETTVSFQVTVPTVKEDTTWTNVATFIYDNNPNNPDTPEDPEAPKTPEETNEVEVTELVPELEVVKTQRVNIGFATDKEKTVKAGDKVVYYITVTNNGNGDATDVVITDKVPEGLILDKDSISDEGTFTDGVITWNFDTIEAGDKITVKFAVTVPVVTEDTTWKNVASVVYGNNPDNPENPDEPDTPIPSNEVTIEEEKVVTPVTGDTSSIAMWAVLALVSAAVCTGVVISKKRRSN